MDVEGSDRWAKGATLRVPGRPPQIHAAGAHLTTLPLSGPSPGCGGPLLTDGDGCPAGAGLVDQGHEGVEG